MLAEITEAATSGGVTGALLVGVYAAIKAMERNRNGKEPTSKCPHTSSTLIQRQADDRADERSWRKETSKTLQGIENGIGKLTDRVVEGLEKINEG